MSTNVDSNYERIAKIKVIGVGGAGNNAVNRMIEENVEGVDFIVTNTDAQVLGISKAKTKLVLGKKITKGLGAGADPKIGEKAAVESKEEIRKLLDGSDMVFIAAGMGGGTGTGAAPIIAKIAKEVGALTIGVITTPFVFEGRARNAFAVEGTLKLQQNVHSLITISNDRLLEIIGSVPLKDSFKEADNILRQSVQSITDLIAVPSLINLDFADVKNVMKNKGNALFGIGLGSGPDKAIQAANRAIISPLLDAHITGATDAIINVTGGTTMTLNDANDAVDIVRQAVGGEVNIIFGTAINEHLEDQMILTVIATGFKENPQDQLAQQNELDEEQSRLYGNTSFQSKENPSTSYFDESAKDQVNSKIQDQYNKYYTQTQQHINEEIHTAVEEADSHEDDKNQFENDLPPFLK